MADAPALTVDQVARDEQQPSVASNAVATSDAPPKAPEDSLGIKPTEETPVERKEDAPPAALSTEPVKVDNPPAEVAPVAAPNGEAKKSEPTADAPVMTGALPGETRPADIPLPSEPANALEPSEPAPKPDVQPSDPAPLDKGEDTAAVLPPAAPLPLAAAPNGETAPPEDAEMKDAPPSALPVASAPVPAPEENVVAPVTGEKRKVEEAAAEPAPAANGDATSTQTDNSITAEEPASKKLKADTEASDTIETATDPAPIPATANGGGVKKSNSRAKREKKPAPPVGKTLRKTRSQGPVES